MKTVSLITSLATLLITGVSSAGAALIFSGSGTGAGGDVIASQVEFDFVQHNFGSGLENSLQIKLTNTSALTDDRGNLLTGVFFFLDDSVQATLGTTSAGFDGLAATVRQLDTSPPPPDVLSTLSNVDIAPAINKTATDGTYQLSNLWNETDKIDNLGRDFSAYEYVIATVAYGLGGLSGAAVNSDDYGIFATGSDLSKDGLPGLWLIDGSATFWILKPAELTSLSQITRVAFGYGSNPNYVTFGIPEPAPLVLLGLGLFGLGLVRWSRPWVAGNS